MIEAVGLHKNYILSSGLRALFSERTVKSVRALDGVSFQVPDGKVLGIVGESGCGKSTLARILMGLERPSSGCFMHDRKDGTSLFARDRRAFYRGVQMVFQDPFSSLNPALDSFRIVAMPLVYQGLRDKLEIGRRVREALEAVGLAPAEVYFDKHPHLLSGGQRQRLCIARALVLEPRNLIADEPLSMLDVSVKWGVIRLLKHLVKMRGLSLVYITHDIATVSRICDQVAVMYSGRIVEIGSTEDVILRPAHPYTKALIAATPRARFGQRPEAPLIWGDISDSSSAPGGCRFYSRCPQRSADCAVEDPKLEAHDGRNVACLRLPRRAATVQRADTV